MTTCKHVQLLCFLLSIVAACSIRHSEPGPTNSDEYTLYSQFIVQSISSDRGRHPFRALVVVSDSTSDNADRLQQMQKSSDLEFHDNVIQRYLLTFGPDTFQLAALRQSYAANNTRPFAVFHDSVQLHLAVADSSTRDILSLRKARRDSTKHWYYNDSSAYMFSFSRAAFNPKGDQALVKVYLLNYLAFEKCDAYFVKKDSQWRLVKTIAQSSGHVDFF